MKSGKTNTTVYRKNPVPIYLYMIWYSFATNSWKWGTLKTLEIKAHKGSTDQCFKDEFVWLMF